ncbi:hypothetical protein BT69DRAFT_1344548 [Atractiella rhizophila]|nr:hypothetical protein BT69DRAFT_1344548 [Atractiella rhizophila]
MTVREVADTLVKLSEVSLGPDLREARKEKEERLREKEERAREKEEMFVLEKQVLMNTTHHLSCPTNQTERYHHLISHPICKHPHQGKNELSHRQQSQSTARQQTKHVQPPANPEEIQRQIVRKRHQSHTSSTSHTYPSSCISRLGIEYGIKQKPTKNQNEATGEIPSATTASPFAISSIKPSSA